MTNKDIVFIAGKFWVLCVEKGYYEVYIADSVKSVRVDTFHYSDNDEKARFLAIGKCAVLASEER